MNLMIERAVALLVAVVVVGTVAVACGDETTTVVIPATEETGLTVTGIGEVFTEPDVAFVLIGVEVQRATVAEAREAGAAAASKVIAAIKDRGVADRDVRTMGLSLYPVYEYPSNGSPRIIGYVFWNTVEAKIRNFDRISEIIDAAVDAGGDAARLQGITFDVEDRGRLLEKAREAAVSDARAKAEQLTRLSGVQLGTPITISEVVSTPSSPIFAGRGAKEVAFDTSTPIEPGTTSVTVQVTVRWSLTGD